jgi:hypothetical protein
MAIVAAGAEGKAGYLLPGIPEGDMSVAVRRSA